MNEGVMPRGAPSKCTCENTTPLYLDQRILWYIATRISSRTSGAPQDTIVGCALTRLGMRYRSPSCADSIAEAIVNARKAALANPRGIWREPRSTIIKNTDP